MDQIQVQKPILVVATDQIPDHTPSRQRERDRKRERGRERVKNKKKKVKKVKKEYSKKKCRTKDRALRNSNINWIFLWRLPIQNQPQQSITEKKGNKTKYLTWNSITFVKKTRMPNPVISLGYINCYSSSSPRPVRTPSNSIGSNCQKICSLSRRRKIIQEIWIKETFLYMINIKFSNFAKTLLTTERRLKGAFGNQPPQNTPSPLFLQAPF